SPFAKTGGLGDVAGSLPAELCKLGADVRLFMPKYRVIPARLTEKAEFMFSSSINIGGIEKPTSLYRLVHNGVVVYLLDNEENFGGSGIYGYGENAADQSVFFCRALCEFIPRLGFTPDVIHCNDWQTALIPVFLRFHYPQYSIKTVLTIHNLQYQGIYSIGKIKYLTGLPDEVFTISGMEFYGGANLLKGGIVYSDIVNTVSPTYAGETLTSAYGEKLEGVLAHKGESYRGILNGLDYSVFHPRTDSIIAANYSYMRLEGKQKCREALLERFGLKADGIPVASVISRLVDQKGLDLLADCIENIVAEGKCALVVLGSGDPRYENFFSGLAAKYPERAAAWIGYNGELAQHIYAGSDLFLMPSRFEPCGLSQLIAMKYGAVPLVRETGGLFDTVTPYNCYTDSGTGFSFAPYSSEALDYTIRLAAGYYTDRQDIWKRLTVRCMKKDYSWKASAAKYLEVYNNLA
ncbi:MAG: glycogen synthase, partial [Clostridia bacterium]|nr:glycogen synthase [Clostridia bacterium]